MGVIQSSINQAAQIGAAIYTQTPEYQQKEPKKKQAKLEKIGAEPSLTPEAKKEVVKQRIEAQKQINKVNPTVEGFNTQTSLEQQYKAFENNEGFIGNLANYKAAQIVDTKTLQMNNLYNRFKMYDPSKISKVENPKSWYTTNYPGDKHIKGGK